MPDPNPNSEKVPSPRIKLTFQTVVQLLQPPPNDIPWHRLDDITDPEERDKREDQMNQQYDDKVQEHRRLVTRMRLQLVENQGGETMNLYQ